ncbi:SH3 domain-containing protein [Magnetospira thiophila]
MNDHAAMHDFHRLLFALLILAALPFGSALAQSPDIDPGDARSDSGLPLPRFVSLRAAEVNMRTGPGLRYPVEWVYHRRRMPMEVIAEYGTWRKVRDWQGTQGWVHQSMLDNRRTMIVLGDVRTLRSAPDAASKPVARVEPGVIGRIAECPMDSSWCLMEVNEFDGWLRRVEFWGVYPTEDLH